ncbi:MAG: hypothetical protein ACFFDN_04625, partial [Candidatus Hodarchaeota archaeon]
MDPNILELILLFYGPPLNNSALFLLVFITGDLNYLLNLVPIILLTEYKNYTGISIFLFIISLILVSILILSNKYNDKTDVSLNTIIGASIFGLVVQLLLIAITITGNNVVALISACLITILYVPSILTIEFNANERYLEIIKYFVFFGLTLFNSWFLIQISPSILGQMHNTANYLNIFAIGGGLYFGIFQITKSDIKMTLNEVKVLLNPIRRKLKKNKFIEAVDMLNSQRNEFKAEKFKLGLKIIDGFNKNLDGIELFGEAKLEKAAKKFKNALNVFTKYLFEIEQFHTNIYLGIIYNKLNNENQAFNYFLEGWKIFNSINDEEFEEFGDLEKKQFLIKKLNIFFTFREISTPTEALRRLNLQIEKFKESNNKIGIKICDTYINLIKGIEFFNEGVLNASLKEFNKALKLFKNYEFKFEQGIINLYRGMIHSKNLKEDKALIYYFDAWSNVKNLDDSDLKLNIISRIIQLLDKDKEIEQVLNFVEEKLLIIDKESNEEDYFETIQSYVLISIREEKWQNVFKYYNELKDIYLKRNISFGELESNIINKLQSYINNLIKNKKFDDAIYYISITNQSLDPYLGSLQPLFSAFDKDPIEYFAKTIEKLFSLQCNQSESIARLSKLKEKYQIKIIEIKLSELIKSVNEEKIQLILDTFINYNFTAQNIFNTLYPLSEKLAENPNNKAIRKYLPIFKEKLLYINKNDVVEILNTWDQIIEDLLKYSKRSSLMFLEVILNTFKNSNGTFAIIPLIDDYYNNNSYSISTITDINTCNKFTEFLDSLKHSIYNFPNHHKKDIIIEKINYYTNILTESYKELIFNRMAAQDAEYIMKFANQAIPTIINSLIRDISLVNPIPIVGALLEIIEDRHKLPELKKTIYTPPQLINITPY